MHSLRPLAYDRFSIGIAPLLRSMNVALTTLSLFAIAAAMGAEQDDASRAESKARPASPIPNGGIHLSASFATPAASAKPTIWWYWGESTTTEHGITKDLEALQRVGFGGVVIYEQVFGDAPDALKSLSPEFMARVRFAAAECARLGLTLEVNAGPGYVAGGPWITPELGMQELVFSEMQIDGGKKFSGQLPKPPSKLNFYRDVAVLAFPAATGSEAGTSPSLTSTPAGLDLATILERKSKKVPKTATRPAGRLGDVLVPWSQDVRG